VTRPSAHKCAQGKSRPVGAVLIIVLIVLSALSLMAFGLSHRVRMDLKTVQMRGQQLQAYHLALAGIRRAMVELETDGNQPDHLGEPWALHTSLSEERFLADDRGDPICGDAYYSVRDEDSRLNINTSSPATWLSLPGVSRQVVESILDWQDADDQPNPQGAESEAYRRLPEPYVAKNGPLTMIEELAYVMNVTTGLLTGKDGNGNGILDTNEDHGPASWPADDADGELDRGLFDYFTVFGNGRVNLNTAPVEILSVLPGMTAQAARALVDYRNGPNRRPGDADDRPLTSVEDLSKIPGIKDAEIASLSECGRFNSTHFRITCEGRSRGGATCRLVATVRRAGGKAMLVSMRQQ
jgi:type II secretory pathway component PulK